MKFLELAKDRYSVRKFSDKKVEKETLDLILEAGRTAPTACNYQPQRILVLDNETDLPGSVFVCLLNSTISWHFSPVTIKT